MKYFKHLFDSTALALTQIFFEHRQADKVIEYYFKNNKKWGKRDRNFFAENVYGCVRWWNQLIYIAEAKNLSPIEQAHRAIAAHLHRNQLPLPEWYQSIYNLERAQMQKNSMSESYLLHAVPEWLENLGQQQLGIHWASTIENLNTTASVVLRTNTLKIDRDNLKAELEKENILCEVLDSNTYPDALILPQRANVFRTECFQKGFFEVQDASSQRVAQLLAPTSGERIIDACAGAGGKSLHLAALMKNKGKIISMDITQWKLDELKKRARRAGTSVIETRLIESTKVIKRLESSADALLLDVPCSGLGVLKRNPDSKWKLTVGQINELITTQKQILESYIKMVKPGGRCVYATCSILPCENQNQVDQFLLTHPDWKKTQEHIILPQQEGFDGFYMARLDRAK